jgi:cell shape-determining protein MreC
MTTIFIILFVVIIISSIIALTLFQNARDIDEVWDKAIRNKQNKNIK